MLLTIQAIVLMTILISSTATMAKLKSGDDSSTATIPGLVSIYDHEPDTSWDPIIPGTSRHVCISNCLEMYPYYDDPELEDSYFDCVEHCYDEYEPYYPGYYPDRSIVQ